MAVMFDLLIGIVVILVIFLTIQILKKRNPIKVGLIAGVIIAVLNSFILGMLGLIFVFPFRYFLNDFCIDAGCILPVILIGGVGIILTGVIIGWIIGKTRAKEQTPTKTI